MFSGVQFGVNDGILVENFRKPPHNVFCIYNYFPEKLNIEQNDFLFEVRLQEVHRAILDPSVVHVFVRMRVPVPMRVKHSFKFLEVHKLTDNTDLKAFILGP